MTATSSDLFSTQVGSTGPRIAFLHGLFGQGKNWTTVAKALSDAARITLVDLPNHGRSAWTDHFSYPEMADQVAELLETQGGGEPYTVVGHSMGGKIAMALALRHPARVERLSVVDVAPVVTAQISNFETFVRGLRSVDLASLTDRESASAQLEPYVPEPGVRSFLLQNLRRDHTGHPGWRWQMNLQLLGDHLPEMGSWTDLDEPPYIGPVLWLAGADSRYIRPEYASAMRALFPRVQLVKIKGAGHWVHSDQPQVFIATIRQFLHL